jgi:hypothetical protein
MIAVVKVKVIIRSNTNEFLFVCLSIKEAKGATIKYKKEFAKDSIHRDAKDAIRKNNNLRKVSFIKIKTSPIAKQTAKISVVILSINAIWGFAPFIFYLLF